MDFYYKGISCEIEGTKIVNTSHALQIIKYYYSLTSTYLCLRVCPSELIRILCQHPPPGIWFSIHSQRLGGWVVSERLPNKSAWSSSYSPGLIKSYFMTSAIQYISASSESKVISESDEVEDIVTKNRNPLTVES